VVIICLPAPQLLEGGRLRAYLPQPFQVPFLISSSLFFLRASTACSSITWQGSVRVRVRVRVRVWVRVRVRIRVRARVRVRVRGGLVDHLIRVRVGVRVRVRVRVTG